MEDRKIYWKETIIQNFYLIIYIPIMFWVVGLISDVMMKAVYTEPAVEMICVITYAYIVLRLVLGIGEPSIVYIVQTNEQNPNAEKSAL